MTLFISINNSKIFNKQYKFVCITPLTTSREFDILYHSLFILIIFNSSIKSESLC